MTGDRCAKCVTFPPDIALAAIVFVSICWIKIEPYYFGHWTYASLLIYVSTSQAQAQQAYSSPSLS